MKFLTCQTGIYDCNQHANHGSQWSYECVGDAVEAIEWYVPVTE